MEALLQRSVVPGVPKKMGDGDRDGYKVFCKFCEKVVLFTGSHRFLDKDLPRLLDIMRTKGGAVVPTDLRAKIRERIVSNYSDPRLKPAYALEGQYVFLLLEHLLPFNGSKLRECNCKCLCLRASARGPQHACIMRLVSQTHRNTVS